MAEYTLVLQPPKGNFIYEEETHTLHVTIDDLFLRNTGFGSWCKDDIRVANAETKVSVLFKPWREVRPGSNRAMYQGVHEGQILYLDIWIDKETRDRVVTNSIKQYEK
jgi:hypothetical protein